MSRNHKGRNRGLGGGEAIDNKNLPVSMKDLNVQI